MFAIKRITIAQHERGLLFRNRSFEAVLEPGVRRIFDPLKRTEVQVYDLTVPEFEHPRVDFLLEQARETVAKYFVIEQIGYSEVGVVYKSGKVSGVLAPGNPPALLARRDRGTGRAAGYLAELRAHEDPGEAPGPCEAAARHSGG